MNLEKHKQLLGILADNQFHSGEEIGQQLKISRAAVWKSVRALKKIGFIIEGISRRGYRLLETISFLSVDILKKQSSLSSRFKTIEVFDEIDSTNTYLIQRIYEYSKIPRICMAEQQTFGRGRRQRSWHSPFAQNIYLSILWRLENHSELTSFSLVVCLAIISVLEKIIPSTELKLKWPNDIYFQGKKLAGVLIETHTEVNDQAHVVIGIGLNVNMQKASKKMIDQAWTSLKQILQNNVERNYLTAKIIDACVHYFEIYQQQGFAYFKNQWNRYDFCHNKLLRIHCQGVELEGVAKGVDNQGRLQIATAAAKNVHIQAGEIVS